MTEPTVICTTAGGWVTWLASQMVSLYFTGTNHEMSKHWH